MNIIDRYIINKAERRLRPFRNRQEVLKKPEFAKYAEYEPVIDKCYKDATYWHGTGRYQYSHANDTRYENVDFKKHIDILELILKEGGLKPHHEPWLKKIQNIQAPTISMSPFRMYARLYAGLYLYEKNNLLYQFGTSKFWFIFLSAVQVVNKKFLAFLFTSKFFRLIRVATYKDIQTYVRSIRNDKKVVIPTLYGYKIRTDIANNYPILVGIKNNIETISFNAGMERLEARTAQLIMLKNITHIEVPLANVLETEIFLKEKGINVIVIPIEFAELYCSQFSFKNLVYF